MPSLQRLLPGLVGLVFSSFLPAPSNLEQDRCAVAVEIVETGDSRGFTPALTSYPERYKQEWAYSIASTCGARGGTALARRFRASRTLTDTARLELITDATQGMLDANVFQAAKAVAEDASASPQARVYAFRTLMWALDPSLTLRYGDLSVPSSRFCVWRRSLHANSFPGAPLPGNRDQQVSALAQRVLRSSATTASVRRAAGCAAQVARTSGPTQPRVQ